MPRIILYLIFLLFSMWSNNVDISETLSSDVEGTSHSCSQLFHLNLAHNNFSSVPVSLACLAVNLTRLNLSFNKLSDMGPLCNYPHSLKHLDLSHNQIEHWPLFSNWDVLMFDEPMSPLSTSSPLGCSSNITCYAAPERNSPKTPILPGKQIIKMNSLLVCFLTFFFFTFRTKISQGF